MIDVDGLKAFTALLGALSELFRTLGLGWTFAISVVVFGGIFVSHYLKNRLIEKGWEKALDAKDKMIEQLNEQNRELRVQQLVSGGKFTKDEAVRLVYRDNGLKLPDPEKAKKQDK